MWNFGCILLFWRRGLKFKLTDLNEDGISEIIIRDLVYCFNGTEYTNLSQFYDYSLENYNPHTGKYIMVYGVSQTNDYAIGYFQDTEFVPEIEFGAFLDEIETFWEKTDGNRVDIDRERFEELKSLYVDIEEYVFYEEELTHENVERIFGINFLN